MLQCCRNVLHSVLAGFFPFIIYILVLLASLDIGLSFWFDPVVL